MSKPSRRHFLSRNTMGYYSAPLLLSTHHLKPLRGRGVNWLHFEFHV